MWGLLQCLHLSLPQLSNTELVEVVVVVVVEGYIALILVIGSPHRGRARCYIHFDIGRCLNLMKIVGQGEANNHKASSRLGSGVRQRVEY